MLSLKNITICAIDCITPNLALMAIKKSMQLCQFGAALLLTSEEVNSVSNIKKTTIKKLNSIDAYSQFVMKDLHQYIETPYVLLVQWDGYVIDPLAWNSSFMLYDYIGATWHWHQDGKSVGNGGFSLRSKKLLELTALDEFPLFIGMPEDEQICRLYRDKLERNFSIKFAPENIANQFSYERSVPDFPTFGFHGVSNMWRYIDDGNIQLIIDEFPPKLFSTLGFCEFCLQYCLMRKFKELNYLFGEWVKHVSEEDIFASVLTVSENENFTKYFMHLCKQILSRS